MGHNSKAWTWSSEEAPSAMQRPSLPSSIPPPPLPSPPSLLLNCQLSALLFAWVTSSLPLACLHVRSNCLAKQCCDNDVISHEIVQQICLINALTWIRSRVCIQLQHWIHLHFGEERQLHRLFWCNVLHCHWWIARFNFCRGSASAARGSACATLPGKDMRLLVLSSNPHCSFLLARALHPAWFVCRLLRVLQRWPWCCHAASSHHSGLVQLVSSACFHVSYFMVKLSSIDSGLASLVWGIQIWLKYPEIVLPCSGTLYE